MYNNNIIIVRISVEYQLAVAANGFFVRTIFYYSSVATIHFIFETQRCLFKYKKTEMFGVLDNRRRNTSSTAQQ